MNLERFLKAEGTLSEARQFLYDVIGAHELFDGSGYTKDAQGNLHQLEQWYPNLKIADLSNYALIELDI